MASHKHFLLVDGGIVVRGALAADLINALGCSVTEASNVADGVEAIAKGRRCDAIIVDFLLSDGSGCDLCVRLRGLGVRVPIIVMLNQSGDTDVIHGLDAGANDYVVKPFPVSDLVGRLRAQLRAFEASEHAELAIGPYIFRPGSKTLHSVEATRPIKLTEKEASVLRFLYKMHGSTVSRKVLLQDLWGYSPDAATHTVETHIYRLRRKMEPHLESQRLIVREGGGYRLELTA